METQPTTPKTKRKIWVSIVAVTLSVLLVASLVLVDAASIKLSLTSGSDSQNAAAGVLADNNPYIDQNEFARIGDVIAGVLRSPQSLDDYYLLASMQIAKGRYEEALNSISLCFAGYHGDDKALLDDLWTKKGCLYAMLGEYDDALDCFANVSDGGAHSADIVQIEAQIYIERKELDAAARCVDAYLQFAPDDTDMRALLAQVSYLNEDYETAQAQYTALIQTHRGEEGELYLMRASCLEKLGMYDEAINDYRQAAERGYNDPGLCWAQCALCAYQAELSEDVLRYGAQAEEAGSEQASWDVLYEAMGVSALQLTRYDEAVGYFTQAIKVNAQLPDAHYYRGVSYMALKDYKAAAADFTVSITQGERAAECCFNRALCYLQTGDKARAKTDLETVLSISQDQTLCMSAKMLLDKWN